MLDVVFMGTAAFAVPSLQAVQEAGHRVLAVVTRPDRPRGRGHHPAPSPVKCAAAALGLPLLQPDKASAPDFVAEVAALRPQVVVVVAYGQLLRPALLELPPLGCVNVHASLLPELRGAAPIQWAILRGYRETGVCTMFMAEGLDTGDVILSTATSISPGETAGELAERLAPVGATLLVRTLELLEAGAAPRTPQDSTRATLAPPLHKEDGRVNWAAPAVAVRNRIHGCNPSPGAFTTRQGAPLKLWRAAVPPGPATAPPGTVVDTRSLVVAAGDGLVELLEVQPASRARVSGTEFARGYRVQPGELWGDVPS